MDFDNGDNSNAPKRPPVKPVGQTRRVESKPPVVTSSTPKPVSAPTIKAPPKTKKSRMKWRAPSKRVLLIAGGAIAVIIVVLCIVAASSKPGDNQPHYKTVMPTGKSISSLGGWRRVSPPEGDPVYAFFDTISSSPITVSQQPIPDNFKDAPDQKLEEMAKSFNATKKIKNTDAYIGTSAKGPQSVLFIRGNTLIMIKSQKEIPETSWSDYIRSLR